MSTEDWAALSLIRMSKVYQVDALTAPKYTYYKVCTGRSDCYPPEVELGEAPAPPDVASAPVELAAGVFGTQGLVNT